MTMIYGKEAHDKVWAMIKDIKFALMATVDTKGTIFHARPMMAQEQNEFTGTLWFFTAADSRKVDELKAHPNALLTYAQPTGQNYVSMSGKATVMRDQAKINELWSEVNRAWFPQGKEDPNLTLIRFDAEEAEFWDSPSSPISYAIGYIKARFTGETPDVGESGRVQFAKAN